MCSLTAVKGAQHLRQILDERILRLIRSVAEEGLDFLWLELDQLIRYIFHSSVNVVEVREAGKVLSQFLRWVTDEHLLHLDEDIECSDHISLLGA